MGPVKAIAALSVVAAVLLPTSGALAAPADDLRAVFGDWQPDGRITECRFTRRQLVNARAAAATAPDFEAYAPGFRDAVNREIARHDAGGCRGVAPGTGAGARARSALRRLRIARIRQRGGLRESVTIRNSGSSSVRLTGATLRDRSGRRIRLRGRLGARRSLRVFTGCAKGRRRAYRRGSSLYACLRRTIWNDAGDVVRIVDRRGVTVAQRGFGRYRRVVRF